MTRQHPYLSKAPVVEAVLEIKTIPAEAWEENPVFEKAKSEFGSDYSFESENSVLFTMKFKALIPAVDNKSETGWSGLRLTSGDNTEIYKLTRESYVYSRLSPYQGWETFKERALQGWSRYWNIAGKQNVKRIGIRFINRIDFIEKDLPELFTLYPVQIGTIEKDIAGYFQQNMYAYENGKYLTNFIQAVQMPEKSSDKPAMIMDIDVYTTDEFIINEKDIEPCLEKIREYKNDIFFGAVNDKLIERLK